MYEVAAAHRGVGEASEAAGAPGREAPYVPTTAPGARLPHAELTAPCEA